VIDGDGNRRRKAEAVPVLPQQHALLDEITNILELLTRDAAPRARPEREGGRRPLRSGK
jgi:hypothetical protein